MSNSTYIGSHKGRFAPASICLSAIGLMLVAYLTNALDITSLLLLILTAFGYIAIYIGVDSSKSGDDPLETLLYFLSTCVTFFGSVVYLVKRENNNKVLSQSVLVAASIFVLLLIGSTIASKVGPSVMDLMVIANKQGYPILILENQSSWLLGLMSLLALPLLFGASITRAFIGGAGNKEFTKVFLVNISVFIVPFLIGIFGIFFPNFESFFTFIRVLSILFLYIYGYFLAFKLPRK